MVNLMLISYVLHLDYELKRVADEMRRLQRENRLEEAHYRAMNLILLVDLSNYLIGSNFN